MRTIDKGVYYYERHPNWDSTRPAEGEQWLYIGYVPFEIEDGELDQDGKGLLVHYFQQYYDRAYFLGEETGVPQEGDYRINSVGYLGREQT